MAKAGIFVAVSVIILILPASWCKQDEASTNGIYPKGALPCKFFHSTKLDCAHRNLTVIPTIPSSASSVDLSHNSIWEVNRSHFSSHTRLNTIKLQYNNLHTIPDHTFSNITLLKRLFLSVAQLQNICSNAFKRLFRLKDLNLSYNFLKDLPAGVFDDLSQLSLLNLRRNEFLSIPDHAFYPLRSLQILDISQGNYTSFYLGKGFRNLTNLISLSLYSSLVSKITQDDFINAADAPIKYLDLLWDIDGTTVNNRSLAPFRCLHALQTLYGAEGPITNLATELYTLKIVLYPPEFKIANHTLDFIGKSSATLQKLTLDNSYARELYGSPFMSFSNLTVLEISSISHSMQFISNEAFNGLVSLKELYLSGNGMNTLPVQAFSAFNQTRSLRVLDLSYNSFTGFFMSNDFQSVSSIQYLDLSGNPLRFIGRWIHELINLKALYLDRNSLRFPTQLLTINWTTPLPSLTNITFEWPNSHKVILGYPPSFIDITPRLELLSLKGTFISNLTIFGKILTLRELELYKCFGLVHHFEQKWSDAVRLPNVTRLILASNQITSAIAMNFNVTTPNVNFLDLNNNCIQELNAYTFAGLENLEYLYLGNNRLDELDGIANLYKLVNLNVSHNSISFVPEEFVQHISGSKQTMTSLDLSGNPFECTCPIVPFSNWILTDNRVFLAPNQMYKCNTPKHLKGMSITEIELDCKSYPIFYIGIGVSSGLCLCLLIAIAIVYRWHIRYIVFILCNRRRRYQPLGEIEDEAEGFMNGNRPKYDVFVSYAHDNDDNLAWVLDILRPNLEEGIEPFRLCIGHARDFLPGSNLLDAISEAIHSSRKTLVVLSPSYLDSEWCYFETQHAWLRLLNEGQDVLIPVLLEPIPDNKMTIWLRQFLCKKGYLRWPKDRGGQDLFWRCLRELIKKETAVDRRFDV